MLGPSLLLLLVGALGLGCTDDSGGATPGSAGRGRRGSGSDAHAIRLPSEPYRVGALPAFGTLRGTVTVDGALPADSIVTPAVDQSVCGTGISAPSVVHEGNGLGNVVVWLSDVPVGKPLPIERRTEVLNEDCVLDPHVQAVIAGTTVNVRNEDRLPHTTVFLRAGTSDTLRVIPLTDDGQVVPDEHLAASAGLIEIRCRQHPWTRGYIAVFNTPYFAVSEPNGSFQIDSLPPGKYHLVAWHERGTRRVEQDVEVQ
ncbi:MAG TPA: hypothetical protein VJU87_07825, partial [Gemmatimonadaceae bacterium]|nr:hypothetical protein [Gemmatimonadaceae bacterium]